MCESRLRRVLAVAGPTLVVEDPDGGIEHASLLAYEGPVPRRGDFVVVHSGYALAPVDDEEAALMLAELGRAPSAPDPGQGAGGWTSASAQEERG